MVTTYVKATNKRSKRDKDFFLVQKALCGDQQAYNTIFYQYYDTVKYAVKKILNDTSLIEDICMETFEKAFSNLARFQPDYQLSAWLVRIGTNRALDHFRHNARTSITSIDDGWNEDTEDRKVIQLKDNDTTPDSYTEKLQDVEFVKKILVKLPYPESKAVRMKYLDDCTFDEIAEEMDLTRKQARKLVKYGVELLMVVMDKEAGLDIDIRTMWQ